MLSDFWLSFIPLFIAFDVFGVLPLYIRFIHRLDDARRKRNLRDSLITAFFTALLFVIMGSKVMEYLGISIEDFLIAGGIVLFIIAAKYIIVGQDENLEEDEMYGGASWCASFLARSTRNFNYYSKPIWLHIFFRFPGVEPRDLCSCTQVFPIYNQVSG